MTKPPFEPGAVTILNVDDNEAGRYVKSRILRAAGYRVLEAGTGADALRFARECRPHLVLLDVKLPDIDGFGVCRTIKQDPALSSMMVLLDSAARVRLEDRVAGLEEGADGYLVEPVQADELLATVKALLRLHQIERRLSETLDATAEGIWDWNVRTGHVFYSRRWIESLGYAPEDVPPHVSFREGLVHPDDLPRVRAALQAHLDRKTDVYECENRLRMKSGAYRWNLDRGRVVEWDEEGRPLRMIGTDTDITARKRAEAALRDSEQRYRNLVSCLPAAMYACDDQGRITFYNDRAAELWGRRPALGDEDEKFCGAFKLFLPDGSPLPHTTNPMAHAVANGTSYRDREIVIERPDGSRRHVVVNIEPIRTVDGTIVGAINVFTDITPRKEAEAALLARSRQFQALYDLASAVNEAVVPAELYEKALDAILASLGADRASILLFDQQGVMRFQARRGLSDAYCRAVDGHSPWTPGQTDAMPILMEDVAAADLAPGLKRVVEREGIRALGFIPLTYGGRVIGKFMVYFNRPRRLSGEELSAAQAIAKTLATGIERKRAEDILRDTEERLRLAVESAQVGTWDLNLLTGDNRWDARCKELFGLPPDAPVLYETFLATIHPGDRPYVEEAIRRATDPDGNGEYDAEYRIITRDRGIERWVRATGRAFFETRDGVRRAVRFTGTALDVTERRKADAALHEGENRLRLALEAGQMGAWDVDLRTDATTWDAKEYALLGLPVGGVEPSPEEFYRRVHPEDRAAVKRRVEDSFRTGSLAGEFRVIHSDGSVRWLAAQGRILFDEQGRPVRMVGINYDVTERKETEERLRSFAHELEARVAERTQELILSQDRLRALATELNLTEQRERKRIATELHDHLAQMLVLGRLKLSQIKRQLQWTPQCMDLIAQTEDVLDESLKYTRTLVADLSPPVLHDFGLPVALKWLGEQMQRHGLSVTVHIPDEEWARLPDDQAMLLFQSVRELLMNVAKHAQCGAAQVSLSQQDSELRIEVRDNGVGLDLAAAAAAAAAAAVSPTALSSKFGLFSIRERMRALGGSFDIQSAPGKGTTATLVLPLGGGAAETVSVMRDASCAQERKTELTNASRITDHASRVRVLLVDDHAMVRQGLRSVLESYADVEVVGEAADGVEAVTLADRLQPALIVMDINMPRKSGIDATAEIKARRPQIAVVGLSVQANGEAQEAMRKAGAAMLLTKEAAVDQLYQAIQDVLAGK